MWTVKPSGSQVLMPLTDDRVEDVEGVSTRDGVVSLRVPGAHHFQRQRLGRVDLVEPVMVHQDREQLVDTHGSGWSERFADMSRSRVGVSVRSRRQWDLDG